MSDDELWTLEEEVEMLSKLSPMQLELYNKYVDIFHPFLIQISEPKKKDKIYYWNGTMICQYSVVKEHLLGANEFSEPWDIATLIAKINYDVEEIPDNLREHITKLITDIDNNPEMFS